MPLGFERLNERTKRPNDHINFIRPLPGPDEALSKDFLERVAAICYPVMKANHIYVMALAEHEPNREFIGRNFNAGEVIELVLKAPSTGQWMPFRHVQMVMMHELAHCKQMNHSKAFWQVRNQYAGELRELWGKNYTGEGLWGRGKTLLSGQYETEIMPEAVLGIDRLCGGTYRSSGKKRKRGKVKPQLSYAERKQRRILRKFGTGGVALGDDEMRRSQLEVGKKVQGKPRVAGSARGRELRAAAALARFEQTKTKEPVIKLEDDLTDSETESEDDGDATAEQGVDTDGKKMTDSRGRPLVSVCGAEDPADDDVQREMRELFDYGFTNLAIDHPSQVVDAIPTAPGVTEEDVSHAGKARDKALGDETIDQTTVTSKASAIATSQDLASSRANKEPTRTSGKPSEPPDPSAASKIACEICSLENSPSALICAACSHVQRPDALRDCWSCQSSTCVGSPYLNSGDVRRCGICESARP